MPPVPLNINSSTTETGTYLMTRGSRVTQTKSIVTVLNNIVKQFEARGNFNANINPTMTDWEVKMDIGELGNVFVTQRIPATSTKPSSTTVGRAATLDEGSRLFQEVINANATVRKNKRFRIEINIMTMPVPEVDLGAVRAFVAQLPLPLLRVVTNQSSGTVSALRRAYRDQIKDKFMSLGGQPAEVNYATPWIAGTNNLVADLAVDREDGNFWLHFFGTKWVQDTGARASLPMGATFSEVIFFAKVPSLPLTLLGVTAPVGQDAPASDWYKLVLPAGFDGNLFDTGGYNLFEGVVFAKGREGWVCISTSTGAYA